MVWKNRWVWTFCIANLFVYIVRMGILDWGPKFLTESRGLDISQAAGPSPLSRLPESAARSSPGGLPTISSRAKATTCV